MATQPGWSRADEDTRLLVIQSRRLGDVLMATPLLRAIARSRPLSRIDVLIEPQCAAALAGNPHVAERIDATRHPAWLLGRVRRARYDVVIDAMGKTWPAILTRASGARYRLGFRRSRLAWCYTERVAPAETARYSALDKLRLASPLGIACHDARLDLPGTVDDAERAAGWWAALDLPDGLLPIALAPISRRADKRWPAERFAWLCDAIVERTGRAVVAIHGPREADQVAEVVARMRHAHAVIQPPTVLPFSALPAAMARCAGYVGNDNGIRHLAIGLGLPTLAIFGHPEPGNWTPPDSPRHLTIGGRRNVRSITIDEVAPLVEPFVAWLDHGTGEGVPDMQA